jgi:DedD protein
MEKKKIVLVAVSVGVFLVIVIGASILVFSPKAPSPVAALGTPTVSTSSPAPVERLPPAVEVQNPNMAPPEVDPQTVNSPAAQNIQPSSPSNKSRDNVFYIYGENPGQSGASASGQTTVSERTETKNNQVVIDLPSSNPVVQIQPEPSAPAAKPAARPSTPSPARKPAASGAAKSTASSGQKLIDNYWVQTGSFSAKVRAETVKESLAAKGITSRIENREVNGTTFFRVRVGPYTSRNEADYWLALIKAIDGFEESQIWKTQTLQ